MLDYKETLAYAEFWRTNVAPHLKHEVQGSVSFSEYLQAYYKTLSAVKTFAIPLPYVYSLKYLEKFHDQCITFFYNSPEEIAKGASVLSAIHQLSPHMHALSNIHIWRDEGENDGHVTTFVVYENFAEILQFVEDNLSLTKEPKEEKKGFFVGPKLSNQNKRLCDGN